jgi:hypothetical protein
MIVYPEPATEDIFSLGFPCTNLVLLWTIGNFRSNSPRFFPVHHQTNPNWDQPQETPCDRGSQVRIPHHNMIMLQELRLALKLEGVASARIELIAGIQPNTLSKLYKKSIERGLNPTESHRILDHHVEDPPPFPPLSTFLLAWPPSYPFALSQSFLLWRIIVSSISASFCFAASPVYRSRPLLCLTYL